MALMALLLAPYMEFSFAGFHRLINPLAPVQDAGFAPYAPQQLDAAQFGQAPTQSPFNPAPMQNDQGSHFGQQPPAQNQAPQNQSPQNQAPDL
jgi:hypothetical protein